MLFLKLSLEWSISLPFTNPWTLLSCQGQAGNTSNLERLGYHMKGTQNPLEPSFKKWWILKFKRTVNLLVRLNHLL